MKYHIPLLCVSLLVACAKNPDKIAAVDLGDTAYAGQSCTQLVNAELAETQKLERLSAKQNEAETGDIVGVVILGVPLSSLAGEDVEAEIGITKGKIQAIERQILAKGCKRGA